MIFTFAFCSNSSISSFGKPLGKRANGSFRGSPASSQCPLVVSLPLLCSINLPCAAVVFLGQERPFISAEHPSPIFSMLGSDRPPQARERLPSVSAPSSPKDAASAAPPIPTLSSTIKHALDIVRCYLTTRV